METTAAALMSALDLIRKRINQIRERKEAIGEQNTKATLIDPLLSALGWDLQEIDEVRREYRRKPQDNPVDYALFLNRTECLFFEAKSLERDLGDRKWISQNLSYATVVGVKWCVLTNGDEYRIYNAHAEVDVEEKLFRSVRISDSDPAFLVETLVLLSKDKMRASLLDELWRAEFIDRRVRQAMENLFAEEDGGLIRVICKRAESLSASEVRASLKRAKIRMDFPVSVSVPKAGTQALPPPGEEKHSVSPTRSEAGKKAWKTMVILSGASLPALIQAGFIRTPLEMVRDYKGTHFAATVREDGGVIFAGAAYDSLSTAAGMARKSVSGTSPDRPYPATNGWTFWQYRDEKTGELRMMYELRKQFLAQKGRAQGA